MVTLYVFDPLQNNFIPCPPEKISGSISNTLITGADGAYCWMTSGGLYQVKAEAPGYLTARSNTVFVPPAVTNLDIRLEPTGGCGSTPVYPLTITLKQVQIFLHRAIKVQIQGMLTLDSGSDGINPASEGVNLRLFSPTNLPGSGQFYPSKDNIMPVYLTATAGGWKINQSEKVRTGIQDLKIQKTKDPTTFIFALVDTKAAIVTQDYQNIIVEISLGNDAGVIDARLTKINKKYTFLYKLRRGKIPSHSFYMSNRIPQPVNYVPNFE